MMHLFGGTKGEYTYKDGSLYVLKSIASGFLFGNFPEKVWFRCMERDGDGFFRIALFGGLFGIHKFVTRQYLLGILYLITCGGCGVFFLYDLIAILMGNYFYYETTYDFSQGRAERRRERIYSRPLSHKGFAIFATICAVVGAYFIVKYGYRDFLQGICKGMKLIRQS